MAIKHQKTAIVKPTCVHSNVEVEMEHFENRNKPNESRIQFICSDCGAKAYIQLPSGQTQIGLILWTWESLTRQQQNKPPAKAQKQSAEEGIVNKLGGDGVGTRLALRFFRAGYVMNCQACDDSAKRMNALGPSGCRNELDVLVEEMLPRAEEWAGKAHPLAKKLGAVAGVDKMLIRRELRKEIEGAIADFEVGGPLT